jgi:hypothetical protein
MKCIQRDAGEEGAGGKAAGSSGTARTNDLFVSAPSLPSDC